MMPMMTMTMVITMMMMMMGDMRVRMMKWIIIQMMVDTGADFEDVSGDSLVSALLRGAARAGFTGPVRAQCVGMSQAVCLFCAPTSSTFGAEFEGVSGEALVSALQRGAARR